MSAAAPAHWEDDVDSEEGELEDLEESEEEGSGESEEE